MTGRKRYRTRRIIGFLLLIFGIIAWLVINPESYQKEVISEADTNVKTVIADEVSDAPPAAEILARLEIKGRAPKTGYSRSEFYDRWPDVNGCSLRQVIIKREMGASAVLEGCDVVAGNFIEPYTGAEMFFKEKAEFSSKIQIDHVVALSDAWQKGAQNISKESRFQLATDPLNLLAVDGPANQQKSDGDAATWLPKNKAFRCQYVARQVSVKYKYQLWVTQAEHDQIKNILDTCPNQLAIGVK